ncbi:MAG TPA: PAS domain S-box protein, partial [Pyrinomonadaceae bacterium]|nr:PAS domain S-box protein [Pyrinomonadaceae bacterium]
PNLEDKWVEIYGGIAMTGEPVRFVEGSAAMNRWFDVYAFRIGEPESRRVALLFNDITERKTVEEKLRFLVDLNHALQTLDEPEEIMSVTARMLGEHLGVNRCAYAEVEADEDSFRITGDYTRDTFSIVGEFKVSAFGGEALRLMRENQPYVVNDAAQDERTAANLESYSQTEIAAVISVPLHKNGRFAAGMAVHQKVPRQWSDEEIELVELVVNRCWESIERARTNKNLRESEERFRYVADAAPVLIWLSDTTKKCVWFNKPWLDFTGRTMERESGDGWAEGVHPEDLNRCLETYNRAFDARQNFSMEYRLRRHDGEYRWLLDNGVPRFSPNGDFLGYIGSCIDITGRRKAEGELHRSRQFNQDVIDSLPTHIAVVDKNGVITAVNRAWRDFAIENGADWTMKSIGIGANYLSICQTATGEDEADGKAICVGLAAVLKREKDAFSLEYPCHSPTEKRWFMLTVAPLTNAEGAVISHLNITSRRLAEEQLRESEEQFRTLSDSIPQLAWMAEPDGSIFWYNERWYEYTGTTPEQMEGWGWQSVHDAEILPQVLSGWRDSIATGKSFEMEFPLKRGSDSTFRWFLTRVLPIRDSEGRIMRWFGTNTDIE